MAFLFGKDIRKHKDTVYAFAGTNAKGQITSLTVVTEDTVKNHAGDILKTLILTNSGSALLISNADINKESELITKSYSTYLHMLDMAFLDHVKIEEFGFQSYRAGGIDITPAENREEIFDYKSDIETEPLPKKSSLKLKTDKYFKSEKEIDKTKAIEIVRDELKENDRESFCVLSFDEEGKPINFNMISTGTLATTHASPRECFKAPILSGASSVIFLHNHPSGDIQSSAADKNTTEILMKTGELFNIKVEDSLIVGAMTEKIFSIKDQKDFNLDKSEWVEFYSAECDEIHSLGEVYKSSDLNSVANKYNEFAGRQNGMGCGIGLIYHNGNKDYFEGMEISSIVSGITIRGDLVELSPISDKEVVQKAVEQIKDHFSNFEYKPPAISDKVDELSSIPFEPIKTEVRKENTSVVKNNDLEI